MKLFEKFTLQRPDHIGYSSLALSKISKLALIGYISKGAYCPLRAFFMCNISMLSHISMAKLGGNTFGCTGNLLSQSIKPLQLCHHYLIVIGKAPKSKGAH